MNYGSLEVGPSQLEPLLEDRASSGARPAQAAASNRQSLTPAMRPPQRPVLKTLLSKKHVGEQRQSASTSASSAALTEREEENPSQLRSNKSFVYTMLNPRSNAWQARIFKWFITLVIVLDLVGFVLSTEPKLSKRKQQVFSVWEGVTSWIFLAEYVLRFLTVTESHKYGCMGPILGRLRYLITSPALIDAVATAPYFLERFTGWELPQLTYVRAFRLLRILKTESFSEASKSVYRVFKYNSEILYVALCIGIGMVLFTSVLMYYARPPHHEQFESLPATIYLATLMLTGQGGT
ncbi:MAG: hypothetical protein SGILL_003774 [Bacillariaceae sp.]